MAKGTTLNSRRRRFGFAGSRLPRLLLSVAAVLGAASAQPAEYRTNAPASFKPDFEPNIPVLVLTARGSIDKAQKTPCTLSMIVPGAPSPSASNSSTGEIKLHGGVSVGFPKNSYGITLGAPARLLDLRESAHWVLNAAFIDRSLMRHKLSYDLFRSLDAPGARRFAAGSRFVEVYLNGNYRGAYLLMERVDRQLLELRRFGSNETSHACIYKAVDHAANFGQPKHAGYEQRERIFVARAENPVITLDGCGAEELLFLSEWRWWTAAEIEQSDAVFVPRTLARILPAILACEYPDQPIDVGV